LPGRRNRRGSLRGLGFASILANHHGHGKPPRATRVNEWEGNHLPGIRQAELGGSHPTAGRLRDLTVSCTLRRTGAESYRSAYPRTRFSERIQRGGQARWVRLTYGILPLEVTRS
jgi:hypothetical protein